MKRVELIYDNDCPNVREARQNLLEAFAAARLPAEWSEWERKSPGSPAYASLYGSPTILVDGRDVGGASEGDGNDCCRVYGISAKGELSGAPSVHIILDALVAKHR